MIHGTFAGLGVEITGYDDSGPFPRARVRYLSSPHTSQEWVAADAVHPVPDPDLGIVTGMYELAADIEVLKMVSRR